MTTHTTICKFLYNDVPSHKPLPSSFGKRKMTNFDFMTTVRSYTQLTLFYARRRQHSQRNPTKRGGADRSQSRCCFWAHDLVSHPQAKSGGNDLSFLPPISLTTTPRRRLVCKQHREVHAMDVTQQKTSCVTL